MTARTLIQLAIALVGVVCVTGCQTKREPFTKPYILDMACSGDGRYIACLVAGWEGFERVDLYVHDTSLGRGARRLTGARPRGILFRPQGDAVALVVGPSAGRYRVTIAEAATGRTTILGVNPREKATTFGWVPSGKGVACWFDKAADEETARLKYYDLATGSSKQIGEWPCSVPLLTGFQWIGEDRFVWASVDYRDRAKRLWVGNSSGWRRVLSPLADPETLSANPGATLLAVLCVAPQEMIGDVRARQAWVVDIATGNAMRLSGEKPTGGQAPQWLPDGSAFVLRAVGPNPTGELDFVAIAYPAAKTMEPLTDSRGERLLGKFPKVCVLGGQDSLVYVGPENEKLWLFDLESKEHELVLDIGRIQSSG